MTTLTRVLLHLPDQTVIPADLTAEQLAGRSCLVCDQPSDLRTGHDLSAVPVVFATVDGREVPMFACPHTAASTILFADCVARCQACGEVDESVATTGNRRCGPCATPTAPVDPAADGSVVAR
jgi:hypothetical protein